MSNIPVNTKTLEEALTLSEEILTAIELETASLSSCMLKASRLARLLNDFDYQQIFMYENGGYPTKAKDVDRKIWQLCIKANRTYEEVIDKESKTIKEKNYLSSVIYQEEYLRTLKTVLQMDSG